MGMSRRQLFTAAAASTFLAAKNRGSVSAPSPAPILSIQRLAWAGIRLKVAGVTLFIDAAAPSPSDGAPGPALVSTTPRSFALVTHHHGDHADPKALAPVLGEHGYIVAHEDVERLFDHRGVVVQSVRMYEPVFLSRGSGEFVAWCVPAVDGLGSPQVSWIIDGGGKRIIHCGDTLWHGGWWDYARAYGPYDAAFLPINGFRQQEGRYSNVTQPMSLTAEQAISAARILRARITVPIHYGASGDPAYVEEREAPKRFANGMGVAGLQVKMLAPGDTLSL